MKRIVILMALALCVSCVFGQTAEKLIRKYRAVPRAEYDETTDYRPFLDIKGITDDEITMIKKKFKKAEGVQVHGTPLPELDADFQQLEGYELLFMKSSNPEGPEDEMLGITHEPLSYRAYRIRAYGKVKKNMVVDLLIRWDMWGLERFDHIDCKLPKDLILKALYDEENFRLIVVDKTQEQQ